MGLPSLLPEAVIAVAESLKISEKRTGARVPWVLHPEQRTAIYESLEHQRCIIGKPRQIGLTTVITLIDALWVTACDLAGEKVRCGIVLDTETKAVERIAQAEDFLNQMGVAHTRFSASGKGPERITFPNGSSLEAYGAGGSRVGSSLSFHRFHFSELPYWQNAGEVFGSLMPALSHDGQAVIETTMDIKDPLARDLWHKPNAWVPVFLAFETHTPYHRDPETITDDEWEWAQEEGFTLREAAAGWFERLRDECNGDIPRCFHLFPQKPEHMFQSSEGRFVGRDPEVLPILDTLEVEGVDRSWKVEIYRSHEDSSGQFLIGVDTAEGKYQDRSAVAVIDKADNQIVASFVSDVIWPDDLALVAKGVQEHWTTVDEGHFHFQAPKQRKPLVIVEENGPGGETYRQCVRLGMNVQNLWMDEVKRIDGLLEAKRAIERGELYGPKDLLDECQSLHRDDLGRFKGAKDLLMACGFALRQLRLSPYRDAPSPRPVNEFNPKPAMQKARRAYAKRRGRRR